MFLGKLPKRQAAVFLKLAPLKSVFWELFEIGVATLLKANEAFERILPKMGSSIVVVFGIFRNCRLQLNKNETITNILHILKLKTKEFKTFKFDL